REVSGVENADPDLYAGKRVILTPTEQTLPDHVRRATELWQAIGGQVTHMTPDAHDAALAAVSHFPHLVAFAFMASLAGQEEREAFLSLAGTGFRDFTRIAAADPQMWRDVLIANQEQVRHQSRQFRRALVTLEHYMAQGRADELRSLLKRASAVRANWRPFWDTGKMVRSVSEAQSRELRELESESRSGPRSRFSLSTFFGTGQ
ncbi:MAG: prephenate dehydrogenase/arogenate dehydrogenase family protein, partial [Burkholderiaceae bacterium]|nr:prephenate dehydrogenase/arogenate dehydrogenase family protein [Burkholderiaceae bacterium]